MENITIIATAIGTVMASIGGWELVKWFLNRKSNKRIAEATADKEELSKEKDEFYFLRERLEFKDKQLMEKEQRFAEQTDLVRSLNKQLLDETIKAGNLQARVAALEAERRMKLCETRGCPNRQPQSGY